MVRQVAGGSIRDAAGFSAAYRCRVVKSESDHQQPRQPAGPPGLGASIVARILHEVD